MTYTIFISYTSKDKQLVTALTNKLNGLKPLLPNSYELKIWDMDIDCLGKWDDTCKNALRSSNAVISLITEHVYPTSYVHNEIDLAKSCCDKGELKFIPVFLTETPVRDDLDAYTKVFCNDGLTEQKLNEIYVKVESNLKETLRLPYVSETVEKIKSNNSSKFFVGREDKFEEIKNHFEKGDNTVVLSGLGGIGKTELARNFVLKYGAEYPNSFIIKVGVSDTDTTVTRSAKDLVRSIRFENTPTDTDDAEIIYRKNLECLKSLDKKTILIIDGYDVRLDLVQDIWQIFNNLNCEVIFTSRQKSEIAPVIDVNELSNNETLQIFAKYCPHIPQNEALEIAKGVDYHTLTVELAARLLGQSKIITAERLKESLFDVKSRIPHDRTSKTATIFEHIENIFDLSDLSLFKKKVLCALCRICNKGLTLQELTPLTNLNEENEHELIELVNAGLVRFEGKYSLHPVISEVAFRKMPITPQSEVVIANFLAYKVDFSNTQTLNDRYALLEYADHYLKKRLPKKRDEAYEKELSKLYANAGWLSHFLGMNATAIEYYFKATKLQQKLCDYEALADTYAVICECYNAISQYKQTLEYAQKCIDLLSKIGKQDSILFAHVHSDVGTYYLVKNDFDLAEQYFNVAHKIYTSSSNSQEKYVAASHTNIGRVEAFKGHFTNALSHYQQALEIQQKLLGEFNWVTSLSYKNIGSILSSFGRYDEALQYLNKTLDIQLNVCGENNPIVVETYINISKTYSMKCNYDLGIKYGLKTLDITTRVLGEQTLGVAEVCLLLSGCYMSLEKFDSAQKYGERALSVQTNLLGEYNTTVASTYYFLSTIANEKGDDSTATTYLKKAIRISKKLGGQVVSALTIYYQCKANAFDEKKQYSLALLFYKKALKVGISTYGQNTNAVASFLISIAECYYNKRNYKRSVVYGCKSLKSQLSSQGLNENEICDTRETLINYVKTYYDSGRNKAAKITKIAEKYLWEFPQTLIDVLTKLYDYLDESDKYQDVLDLKIATLKAKYDL